MKVAIVHDWLVVNGGAEKVLEAILEIYPQAELFSLVDFLDDRRLIKNKKVITSFIQNLPFAKKYFRYYLPLFPAAVEEFDLREYDIIISSSYAVAKGVLRSEYQTHFCYIHTPMRYAWDLYFDYTSNLSFLKKLIVKFTLHRFRIWDVVSSNRVDHFIANSNSVQKRVKKTYNRDSIVITPPVNTDLFKPCFEKEEYYFTASRLVEYKRIDLIIHACNRLGKRLIVAGDGEQREYLKSIAGPTIEFAGYVEDEKLVKLLQKAKAFIFAAYEDFGILPVEAQACATPVIALNRGGTAQSVIDSLTGVLYENQSVENIIQAIEKFESQKFDLNSIVNHAKTFDKELFKANFESYVRDLLKK